jgi:antitoxin PrlF
MATAKLTTKGRVTIPASVRSELHVKAGDRLEFVKISEGRFELVAAVKDVCSVKGMVSTSKAVSLEEMNAAIRQRGANV